MDVAALLACTRCGLSSTRQRVVVGTGPERAGLMVVGEAPGRTEDEGGEPFTGRSGRLLTRLIEEEVGLLRDQYFITNVIKCRPPLNRPPRRDELLACRPWLEEQLRTQRPSVVLAVGATAAKALYGVTTSMREAHGRVATNGDAHGVVTYHPAAVLRQGRIVEDVMRTDLALVKALLS